MFFYFKISLLQSRISRQISERNGEKGMLENTQLPILLKIQAMVSNLSKSEQRVVKYILDNPSAVVSMSVAELAERSEVSDATVIRACRSIGFANYQDMKVTLVGSMFSPLRVVHTEIQPEDSGETIIDKVFSANIQTLQYTHSIIDKPSVILAAEKLAQADQVLIFGMGSSNAVAHDLEHKLLRLGKHVCTCEDSHLQQIVAVNSGERDVVVAISQSGSSIDVVDAAQRCKKNGAYIIAMTNVGKTPLSKIADVTLYSATKESNYHVNSLTSRIAQMTIIDSLYTLIAVQKENVRDLFYEIDKSLNKKKY